MALTAASTFDDAYAQMNNSLAWEGNVAKATDWLEAVRFLEGNRPKFAMRQNAQINWESLKDDKEVARKYVADVGAASVARRAPFVVGRPRAC